MRDTDILRLSATHLARTYGFIDPFRHASTLPSLRPHIEKHLPHMIRTLYGNAPSAYEPNFCIEITVGHVSSLLLTS